MQGAPRILIVDDSEEDVLLAAAQIRRWARDALIRRVDNSADFSAAIQSASWDLVLCDHHMPNFDSGAALELLNSTGRSMPFFVYSGYFSPTQRENAVREGASGYVDKRDIAGLMRTIDRTLNPAPAEAGAQAAGGATRPG